MNLDLRTSSSLLLPKHCFKFDLKQCPCSQDNGKFPAEHFGETNGKHFQAIPLFQISHQVICVCNLNGHIIMLAATQY